MFHFSRIMAGTVSLLLLFAPALVLGQDLPQVPQLPPLSQKDSNFLQRPGNDLPLMELPELPDTPALIPEEKDTQSKYTPKINDAPVQFGPINANPPVQSTPEEKDLSDTWTKIPTTTTQPFSNAGSTFSNVGKLVPQSREWVPQLSLRWQCPDNFRVNKEETCYLVVKNTSKHALSNLQIRLPLADNFNLTSPSGNLAYGGKAYEWVLDTLLEGQEVRLRANITPRSATQIPLRVTVSATTSHQINVAAVEPKLLANIISPEKTALGSNAIFQLELSNPGSGPTEELDVKIQISEGLHHVSGSQMTLKLAPLQEKEKRTFQLVCQAKLAGKQKVALSVKGGSELAVNQMAQVVVESSSLRIIAEADPVRTNSIYTINAQLNNPGLTPAGNVVLQSQLPPSFHFVSTNHGGVYNDKTRTVTWFFGDMPDGDTKKIALRLRPLANSSQAIVFQAKGAPKLHAEAKIAPQLGAIEPVQLEIAESQNPVRAGSENIYEVRIRNIQKVALENLTLVCTLPDGMDFRGARVGVDLAYQVRGSKILFAPLTRLAPGADVYYRIHVLGRTNGEKRVQFSVQSEGMSVPIQRERATTVIENGASN